MAAGGQPVQPWRPHSTGRRGPGGAELGAPPPVAPGPPRERDGDEARPKTSPEGRTAVNSTVPDRARPLDHGERGPDPRAPGGHRGLDLASLAASTSASSDPKSRGCRRRGREAVPLIVTVFPPRRWRVSCRHEGRCDDERPPYPPFSRPADIHKQPPCPDHRHLGQLTESLPSRPKSSDGNPPCERTRPRHRGQAFTVTSAQGSATSGSRRERGYGRLMKIAFELRRRLRPRRGCSRGSWEVRGDGGGDGLGGMVRAAASPSAPTRRRIGASAVPAIVRLPGSALDALSRGRELGTERGQAGPRAKAKTPNGDQHARRGHVTARSSSGRSRRSRGTRPGSRNRSLMKPGGSVVSGCGAPAACGRDVSMRREWRRCRGERVGGLEPHGPVVSGPRGCGGGDSIGGLGHRARVGSSHDRG